MNDYPAIRNVLSSLFSIQTGLEDSAATAAYHRVFKADKDLQDELKTVFDDRSVSWREMLFNTEYEVYEAESENEAISYALKILLPP